MNRRHMGSVRIGLAALTLLVGCASSKEAAKPSASAPAAAGAAQPVRPAEDAERTEERKKEVAAPPAQAPAPPPPQAAPGAQGAPAPLLSRQAALAQASRDLDAAGRELDVAAGDCRNACRALASMDRAAGRICALEGRGEQRCDGAKDTLRSSRDRVKQTCGECAGGPSVDRDAPIPSLR